MLGAKLIGEWCKNRGIRLKVKPTGNGFKVKAKPTKKAQERFKQKGFIVKPLVVADNDLEVALKVLMNLYDREPGEGALVKKCDHTEGCNEPATERGLSADGNVLAEVCSHHSDVLESDGSVTGIEKWEKIDA